MRPRIFDGVLDNVSLGIVEHERSESFLQRIQGLVLRAKSFDGNMLHLDLFTKSLFKDEDSFQLRQRFWASHLQHYILLRVRFRRCGGRKIGDVKGRDIADFGFTGSTNARATL